VSPYARYSILRILLFAVVLLIGYAVGMREFLLLVFALVVSAVLSYLLLGGPRQALVERLQQRTARRHERAVERQAQREASGRRSRSDEDNAAEDAEDESRRG